MQRKLHAPLRVLCVLGVAMIAPAALAEQVWYGQSAAVQATDALRLLFSNTTYTEHGDHFANEEAVSFRHRVSEHWLVGAGITWGQNKIGKTWHHADRPTEHVSFDGIWTLGGWTVFDAQHFNLYFREGERDWVLYRNIGSLTAPPVPEVPWMPRPYLSEQIYLASRECFTGFDRFCQLRLGGGVRLQPAENLTMFVYWQYRDIERPDGEWKQFRIAGMSLALAF